jgi:hypothetical protein
VARSGAQVDEHGEQASRSTSLAPTRAYNSTLSDAGKDLIAEEWADLGRGLVGHDPGSLLEGDADGGPCTTWPARTGIATFGDGGPASSWRETAPEACREKKDANGAACSPCPALS